MKSSSKKIEIAIIIAAVAILVTIWTINGYEDTWLYASAILISIPASWFFFGKKSKGK